MIVSDTKRQAIKSDIRKQCGCSAGCPKCYQHIILVDKFADANIPVGYWFKSLEKFNGSQSHKKFTTDYISSIAKKFTTGAGVCFSGQLGTGKTYSLCCVLKSSIVAGYSAYYTTLTDMIFYLTTDEYKKNFHNIVTKVDFLCIDECDSRHLANSETSLDFFGRTLERVLRYRVQNNLPLLLATNASSIDDVFSGGQFSKIFNSISKLNLTIVPALGPDFRLKK